MSTPAVNSAPVLDALQRELDAALDAAARHAAGNVDAEAFTAACARLAQAVTEFRPALQSANRLQLKQLHTRLQTLYALHARLSAQACAALAALLPHNTSKDYTRLGSTRSSLRTHGD